MSRRSVAGAVLITLFSSAAVAAQDLAFQATPRSLVRPDAVSVGLLRPTFRGSDAPDAQGTMGFLAAVHSSQQLSPGADIEVGVGLSRRGSEESSGSFTATTRTMNVEVPVLVRLNASGDGTFGLPQRVSLVGGVQGDVTVSCEQTMTSSGYSSSSKCVDEAAFDLALVIGAGVAFTAAQRRMIIDVAFTNGFFAVFKNAKVFNRSLDVKVKVPLRKGR